MAGAGWRDFVAGEVLTAANVQDYLQDQAVMTFASSAARGSAIASPSEGMVAYLKDTNAFTFYNGTAWAAMPAAGYNVKAEVLTESLLTLSNTYTDVTGATITVTCAGVASRITVKFHVINATSGAARSFNYRLMDGANVLGTAKTNVPVSYITASDQVYTEYTYTWTPSAGSHTFKLQAQASAASALQKTYAYIVFEEKDV